MAIKPITRYGKFTPSGLDRSGEMRMRALAGLGEQMQGMAISYAKTKRESEAQERGLQAGKEAAQKGEDLELVSPLAYGGSARNKYAQEAYLQERSKALTENIARIAADNPTDYEAFNTLAKEYTAGMVSTISPNMRTLFDSLADDYVTKTSSKILEAQLQRDFEADDAIMVDAISNYQDEVATSLKTGNTEDALLAYNAGMSAIDARNEAGRYASEVEYENAKKDFTKNYQVQEQRAEIIDLVDSGKAEEALERVQNIRKTVIPGFTATETEELAKILDADLTNYLNDRDAIAAEKVVGLSIRQDQNAGDLFTGILSGNVDQLAVTTAFNKGQIDFDQYKVLSNAINTRGIGTDKAETVSIIQEQIIENPKLARQLISQAVAQGQLSTETAMTLNEKAITNESSESPLQQSEPKRYRQSLRRILQVDNIFSEFNEDDRANRENIVLIYDDKVLSGEDPVEAYKEATAQIKAVTAIAPPPYKSLVDLDAAWGNGQITDDQYKALFNNVQAYEMYLLDLKELGLE